MRSTSETYYRYEDQVGSSEDLDLVVSKLALEPRRRGLLIMEGLFTAFLKLFEQQLQGLDFLLQAQYGFGRIGEV